MRSKRRAGIVLAAPLLAVAASVPRQPAWAPRRTQPVRGWAILQPACAAEVVITGASDGDTATAHIAGSSVWLRLA